MDLLFTKNYLIDLTPEVTDEVEEVHAGCLDAVFVDLNLKGKMPVIPKYQQKCAQMSSRKKVWYTG